MKHFLSYVDESIKANWNSPALSNYGANTYTYGDVASGIEKMHILFEQCGIKKGEKIAICSRNSAEWCIAYFAVVSYDAVCVPLLADFLPQNVADLTRLSDSRLLMVDDSIYGGLKRDNILTQFEDFDNFCGLVSLADLAVLVDCKENLTGINEKVDAAFAQRFPNGVAPEHIDYRKDNFDALAVITRAVSV